MAPKASIAVYGFEETLRRRDFEDGSGVPLFFLGFNAEGEAVAGVRFHGPLESSHQANMIEEMADSHRTSPTSPRSSIARFSFGALESQRGLVKG